jgi:WD40 repeat protein
LLRPSETSANSYDIGSKTWYEFSPNGKLLATAGRKKDFSAGIRIWDVERESLVDTIAADRSLPWPVTRIAFSPDNKKVAIALPGDWENVEKTVIVRDLDSGKERTFEVSAGEFIDLEFSNDAERLRAYNANAVMDFDLESGECQQTDYVVEQSSRDERPPGYPQFRQALGRPLQWVRQSRDKRLLAYTHGSQIRLVERASGDVRTLDDHSAVVRSIDLALDGRRLVSGSEDNTIRVWDLAGAEPPTVLPTLRPAWSLALSPDGVTLASGHYNGQITLWDLRMNAEILTIDAHPKLVEVLRFSPDGTVLASGGWDGSVRLWKAPRTPQN